MVKRAGAEVDTVKIPNGLTGRTCNEKEPSEQEDDNNMCTCQEEGCQEELHRRLGPDLQEYGFCSMEPEVQLQTPVSAD